MLKTIGICGALFTTATVGIRVAAHVLQASHLPAVAAVGMFLVGIMLIAIAPSDPIVSHQPDLQASEDELDHETMDEQMAAFSNEPVLRSVPSEASDMYSSLPM